MSNTLQLSPILPGRYVLAVSGGVDSMVLLDILRQNKDLSLIVAHFDHGIRKESRQDRKLVQKICMSHNIIFEFAEGKLGTVVSEATARQARYSFLRQICNKYNVDTVITAHHQDDIIETVIINLLRGTGRKGLTSLNSGPDTIRPLLEVPKKRIIEYAKQNNLEWREDKSNSDQKYLRNYVRHNLIPLATRIDTTFSENILVHVKAQYKVNDEIKHIVKDYCDTHFTLNTDHAILRRYNLLMAPKAVALELLQCMIEQLTGKTLERTQAERALLFVKVGKLHKRFILNKQWQIRTKAKEVIVEPCPPVVS